MHSVAETENARGGEALYLVQLIVFLHDQSDDVTHQGDFPLREARLQELLLAQHRLVVEHVPQRLPEITTAVLATTGLGDSSFFLLCTTLFDLPCKRCR